MAFTCLRRAGELGQSQRQTLLPLPRDIFCFCRCKRCKTTAGAGRASRSHGQPRFWKATIAQMSSSQFRVWTKVKNDLHLQGLQFLPHGRSQRLKIYAAGQRACNAFLKARLEGAAGGLETLLQGRVPPAMAGGPFGRLCHSPGMQSRLSSWLCFNAKTSLASARSSKRDV